MEAHAVAPRGLEQPVGPLDVGLEEGLRVGDGVVVVAFGGVVDDGVVAGDEAVEQCGVADVAHHELDAVFGQAVQVAGVARVGELVEDRHVPDKVVFDHVMHEVAADEAAAARDDDVVE